MALKDWSTTAGSNTSAPPNGAPESSTTLADTNDIMRQIMADVRTLAAATTLAAGATTNLASVDNTFVTLTGTATTITGLGTLSAGMYKYVIYNDAHTLTYNATSLMLLGNANRTVAAGDISLFLSEGSGNWRELLYQRASGAGAFSTLTASSNVTFTVNSASDALKITQTGAGNAILVEDASSDTTPWLVDAAGTMVSGHTASITLARADGAATNAGNAQVVGSTANAALSIVGYNSTVTNTLGPALRFARSYSGTVGTNTAVESGHQLGMISFQGADGTNYIRAAEISCQVDGTPGIDDMPGRIVFKTTADGATAPTEALRIDASQNVSVTAAALLGYGTGAGGTVTQLTSKSTGVTLNKPTGRITMNNEALDGASSVEFTLTNSVIPAAAVVMVTPYNNSNYRAACINVAAGSCVIRVTNITALSKSEAVELNFNVFSGATS